MAKKEPTEAVYIPNLKTDFLDYGKWTIPPKGKNVDDVGNQNYKQRLQEFSERHEMTTDDAEALVPGGKQAFQCLMGGNYHFSHKEMNARYFRTSDEDGVRIYRLTRCVMVDDDRPDGKSTQSMSRQYGDHHHGFEGGSLADRDLQEFCRQTLEATGHMPLEYEYFWAGYSLNLMTKNRVFSSSIMEKRSFPVFKMYMDLDLLFARDPSDASPSTEDSSSSSPAFSFHAFYSHLCKIISRVVMDFYPTYDAKAHPNRFLMTMSVTSGVTVKKFSEEDPQKPVLWKRGIHLVWPELLVTREIAYQFVRAVCIRLQEKQGEKDGLLYRDVRKGENPWSFSGGVIDTSVYSSGLRINGMPKAEKCPQCFPNRSMWIKKKFDWRYMMSNFCQDHRARPGYILRPETIYEIKRVYRGTKLVSRADVEEYTKSFAFRPTTQANLDLMRLTGIRTGATEATDGFQPHRMIVSDVRFITSEARQDEDKYLGAKTVTARKRPPTEVSDRTRNKRELFPPPDLHARMQTIIRRFGGGPYRQVVLDKVLAYKTSSNKTKTKIRRIGQPASASVVCEYDKIVLTLQGTGCHFCMKKGSEHTSNTAFFVLLPTCQIFQGCWSPNAHHGKVCRSYTTQNTTPPIFLDLNTNQADHETAIEMLSLTMNA